MQIRQKLTASLEDYLEAILELQDSGAVARVRDIAERVGVGMPSVTAALKSLSTRKLVNYDKYQYITLTPTGRKLAKSVTGRHDFLRGFFADVLGLDADTSDTNACRMEHALDEQVLDRMKQLADFIRSCPRSGDDWLENFRQYAGDESSTCRQCVASSQGAQCKGTQE